MDPSPQRHHRTQAGVACPSERVRSLTSPWTLPGFCAYPKEVMQFFPAKKEGERTGDVCTMAPASAAHHQSSRSSDSSPAPIRAQAVSFKPSGRWLGRFRPYCDPPPPQLLLCIHFISTTTSLHQGETSNTIDHGGPMIATSSAGV